MALSFSEYRGLDAVAMAELVRSGQVTPAELLETAIARAEAVNPVLNAICHPMYEAGRVDAAAAALSAPLAGVPFLLKDITTHRRGWPMTSGSLVMRDQVSSFDSEVVKRYLAAGLVLFGRTTTPEFGYAASAESRLFGPTRNPWDLSRTAGGSSGGAAAAVAAGVVPAAQGGDAGGSIRIPASFSGLFGIKPTRARVPAGPAHGAFLGFSTTHVLSRSVRDSALLLDVTHGPDTGAPYAAPPPRRGFLAATRTRPKRLRIALQRRAFDDTPVDADCIRAIEETARLCEKLGHEVIEADLRFDHGRLREIYFVVWPMLVMHSLDQHARATGRPVRMEELETYVARLVDGARRASAGDFIAGLESMTEVSRLFRAQSDAFDLVLSPTTAQVAPQIGVLDPSNPDQDQLDAALAASVAFTQIHNVTGQPAASIPLYWTEQGIPVGSQFAARFGDEETIFALAAQLEEARPWFGRAADLSVPDARDDASHGD
ncbi:amidase [Rhizorhabdus histidinilytica]|uniref:Amidase n=1 Tax=Rhizorhabdus histidinilytica TaxID=439228 RepID=A0A1T5CZE6_9SPHN|nr:amidase [Rhizorhabdus histidinilytica]SKB64716.1 amidase [Rhizorhabdus histidinilytica]